MKSRRLCLALALGALLLISVGCSQGTPEPPAAESMAESPLLPTAIPILLPRDHTPPPDLGIVQGVLSLNDEPAPERTLYLAAVISSGEGMEIAALDPVEDDRAESDASGYFVFLDVSPGRYALGINSPIGPVLIRGADGQEIVAEVQAGEVVDLGTVKIVSFNE
jgi:hypothetical protein